MPAQGYFEDADENVWPEPDPVVNELNSGKESRQSIFSPATIEDTYTRARDAVKGIGKGLTDIQSRTKQFIESARYPDFIAEPLALRNPVITDQAYKNAQVNPEALKFLSEFKPKDVGYMNLYRTPYDTNVTVTPSGSGSSAEIAFGGPFGFKTGKQVQEELKTDRAIVEDHLRRGETKLAEKLKANITETESKLNQPLRSPALRYALGQALEDIPVGTEVKAAPVGGPTGARARIYERLTNSALTTDPRTNYIRSLKTEPDVWVNTENERRVFDPSSLKDEMIRATYNLPKETDVSNLRSNPLGILERTDRIDFNRPVITPQSPVYKFRRGLAGGLSVGAADFIPSPEVVQDLYAGRPLAALRRQGQEVLMGLPAAAAAGGAAAFAPALAPVISAAGPALAGVAAGRALNEVVRQQSGEGIVPKLRQALGTAPRTGAANPPSAPRPYVQPRLTRTQPVNPVVREIQNRFGLAGERFNPARGEFGLSELFFGR